MKNENPFKQKLYHHTMPVSDDLWNRIESHLPVTGRRKKFPFLMLALTSILLIAAAFLLWPSDKINPAPDKNHKENKGIPDTPHSQTTTDDISATQTLPSDQLSATLLTSTGEISSQASTISLTSTSSSSSLEFGDDPQVLSTSNSIPNRSSGAGDKINSDISFSPSNKMETASNTTSLSSDTESFSLAEEHAARREAYILKNTQFNSIVSALPFGFIDMGEEETHVGDILAIKPDPSCYKFTGAEKRSNVSVDLFVGPGYGPRSFTNTTTETIQYAEARDKTENNRYVMSAGARINLNLNEEIAVRAGFIYEVIGDVFNYSDSAATRSRTEIDSFFSANGTFLYADTIRILEPGTHVKRIHNRYHHLDIPLLVSYEMPMGRSRLMINAGPVLNLTTSYRGQILDPMLVPRHITEGASQQLKAYKNNLGLAIYLGAGALVPISKRISGLIEPRFLYRLKPVTLDNYPLKERRHFAGLNLGIRYHFE